jgi:hypothetical protein
MSIEKAKLICFDGGKDIEFMFNPKELTFQQSVETADNPGQRSEATGQPKVSFSNLPATTVTISNILFDTYETGEDVVSKYIIPFQEAVKFVDGKERPPVYTFLWRKPKPYLDFCFVEGLNYKLTKFLADGTPVRAVIDSLTLKETEKPEDLSGPIAPQSNPQSDNVQNRKKAKK